MNKPLLFATFLIAALTGCGQSSDNSQIKELQNKVAALEKENADLKLTAAALEISIQKQLASGNIAAANEILDTLQKRYPASNETNKAEKDIKSAIEKKKADDAQAERIKTLGYIAIGTKQEFDTDSVKVKIDSANLSNRWSFDDYGYQHSYRESPRGSKFMVLKVSITTKAEHNPKLPGFAAYIQKGDNLIMVDESIYEFARWMDYGTYLGNGHDFRNDFTHTSKINFSIGMQLSDADLKQPVFIVASKSGCVSRTTERFERPTISYKGSCPALKKELALSDFSDNKLVIVKSLNASK